MTKYVAKQKRNERFNLQKAVLAMLATGMVAWPSFSAVYAASTITNSNGTSLINAGDMVHNIYSQQRINSNVGMNKFRDFNVDSGNVANLHFRTSTSTEHFNALMNFVDNRININGTVNAIRNNKIGGHLFFLSPNGMVVGASGAINTGSLTVIAPTLAGYNRIVNDLSGANASEHANKLLTSEGVAAVPLNPSGSIVVQGKINAVNNVNLRAGQIYVGTDGTQDASGNYKNLTEAKIETGVTDFRSIVNISGMPEENLIATRDANTGDINLVADVQLKNASGSTATAKVVVDGGATVKAAKDVTILAKVENNANAVKYEDNEGHTKYIVNGEITDTPPSETGGFMSDRSNDLRAIVEIGKSSTEDKKVNITAQNDVKINALVENNFETGLLGGGDIVGLLTEIPSILLNVFTTGEDAVVGFLESNAEVDVCKNSVINSDAGNIDILAQAKNKLVLGASVSAFNMIGATNNTVNSLPSLSVSVGSNKTDATVKVDGTITAEAGKVDIRALGDNTFNTSATIGTGYHGLNPNDAVIAAAVDVAWGHNNARVEIGSNANITAKKDLTVLASAKNAVKSATGVKSTERNDASFVVDVLEYDSSAAVDVKGELKSEAGNLFVVAEDEFSTNSLTASSETGATSLLAGLIGEKARGGGAAPGFIERLMRSVAEKLPGEYFEKFAKYGFADSGDPGEKTAFQQLMDKIKLGVSVGYMNENNRAVVNIAKTAKLTAAEKVDLHAKVYHYGIETKVAGSVAVSSNRHDTATEKLSAMGGGAIIIRDVDNTAEVIIDGRDAADEDNIKGRNVEISAETKIESHNVQNKIIDFQNLFDIRLNETEFKSLFPDMDDDFLEALWQAYKNNMYSVGKEFFETDAGGNVVYGADGLPKVKADYINGDNKTNDELYEKMQGALDKLAGNPDYKFLKDLMEGKEVTYRDKHGVERKTALNNKGFLSTVFDACMGLYSAIDASNWVDFNVGSAVSHIYKGEGNNPKFAGNVMIAIDDVSNTANVLIGKNNRIKADNDMVIKTDTFFETAYVDGKLASAPFKGIVSKMTGSYGLNVMVGLRDLAQNSMIVAAENVQMAAKNLKVDADATAKVVGVTEFIVTGAATSAVGSLALELPSFVNNNLISFDDEVKLDVTGGINLTGKNYLNEEIIAGGLVSSGKASGALIVQVFNQKRNNLVVVADNDDTASLISDDEKVPELQWNDYTDSAHPENDKSKDTDEQRVKKLIAANLLTDDSFRKKHPTENKTIFDREKAESFFGTGTKIDNTITAGSFYSNAKNEGEIVTAVADVALSLTGGSLSGNDGPGFFDKLKDKLKPAGDFAMKYVVPAVPVLYWPLVGAPKLIDFFNGKFNSWLPMENHGVPGLEYPPDSEVPPVSLTAAGSVSVDTFKVRTASVVENVQITLTGAEVTKNNKTETVYNFSNIASDTTGMVNVAGSAAAGTKGYSKDFTAQYNDAYARDDLLPAEDREEATLVTLSGAAAVGMLVNDLNARVVGAKITDVKNFYNESIRDGHLATAAAAVAISLPKTFSDGYKKTTSAALAGGISLNFGTYSTLASLKNNLVTGTDARPADLFNIAQTQDIMVSGGIDVAFAKGSSTTVGMGAVVAYAAFGNDVTAEIKDDGTNDADKLRKYSKIRNVENIARSSLTQATMAVGIGVAIQKGEQARDATVALQGAAAVNNIGNNVFAVTEGITLDAKNLQVLAYDFKRGDVTLPGEMAPEPIANDRMQEWEKSSITLFRDNKEAVKKEGQKNVENYYKGETKPVETLNEQGNLIITGALELSLALAEGAGGSGSAGAALGISLIDNNFVAEVKTSSITLTDAVKYDAKDASKVTSYPARVLAESNTEKWGMVAGANASRTDGTTSVTIGGSILLDFINNDVTAKVEKSNITTDGLCLDAYNKEKYVNGTGYFGLAMGGDASNSVGVGLGIVYNKTLNNTAARLLNTDVSAYTPSTGTVIGLYADSDTDIYAFAFGAGASNFGLTANVAVNVGQTNVEAIVEDTDESKDHVLDDVKSLTVHSKDDTYRMAIAGNVNVASTAALGAALTWNRIGHWLEADDDILKDFDKKDAAGNVVQTLVPSALSNNDEATQTNRARVSGYKVVTVDDAKVDVSATDNANFTTISIGAVLNLPNVSSKSINFSAEGANANSMIDKTTEAELFGCTMGKQSLDGGTTQDGSDNITVNVNASTDNKSLSSADVLSLSVGSGETKISFGAAVVENTIQADTKANVSGTYTTKNMLVKAVSNQDLDNYAFGVAATRDFALGGNVVVNTISGDTTAGVGNNLDGAAGTNVYSSGSLGVIAESYEELTNGSGQLAASVGSETLSASGGVAVAVNSISGDTLANIVNADVVANGSAGAAAYAHKDSADMKRKLANKTLKKPEDYVAPTYTGLIVGADAFHHLNDVTACGSVGLSKAGGATFGVDATVAVDKINGSTKALVDAANINQSQTSVGNVNVLATDALESYSKVFNGGLSLSLGEGVFAGNIGAGVLVNNNNRTVQAGIGGTSSCILNAKDLHVLADSYADVDLLNVGISFVVSGSAGTVEASVTSADVEEITDAYIKNMHGTADNITVESGHEDDFDLTGTNLAFAISTDYVAVAIGVQVNNITDKSTANALIEDSTFTHYNNNFCTDTVKANNVSDIDTFTLNPVAAAGGAEVFGLGGAGIGVMVVNNDLEQITLAKVNNSNLADETKQARYIFVQATGSEHVDYCGANVTAGTGAAIGVATLLNDINTTTRADVIGSTLYAGNDITVSADEKKQLDNTLAQVAVGAFGVGVPVIHNYIGMDVDSASEYTFVQTAKENIDDKDDKKENKKAALDKIGTNADQSSFSATKIQNFTQQAKTKFNAGNTPLMPNPYVDMAKKGVAVNIENSTLEAGNKLNILSRADTNSNSTLGGGSLAVLNIMVPVNRQRLGENISVNIGNGSNLTGTKGVTVYGIVSGKMENHTTEVAVSGVGVLVTTTELTKQKEKGISITVGGTTINTKGNLEISTSDTLSLENHLTQVGVGATDFGAIVSTTQDNSDNKIKLNAGNNFTAKNITVQANSTPMLSMDNTNVSVSAVRGAGMINEVSTNGNTELNVIAGSAMKADKIDLKAQLLADDKAKYTLKSDIHAVGVSAVGIGVDKSRTYSTRKVNTQVGNITLSSFTDNTNLSAVNIAAFDGTVIDNYIRTTSVGIFESESNFAQSKLINNVTTSVDIGAGTWNAIDNLQVTATGNTKVKAHAKGTSGSNLAIMPYAAQVENKIDSDAILTIKGNYVVGAAKLYAEQANEMQLCADSLTVTVVGGSGTRTYNDVTFDTTTNINGANITATDGDVRIYANTLANLNKLGEVDPDKKFSDKDANCLVLGNGVGGFDIEVAKGDNKITFNDTLNITNSTITGAGDIILNASSAGILRSQLFDYTVNINGGAQLRLYNTINSTNTINYTNSTITGTKAEQDITLAVYDNLEVTAATYTEMSAGAAGATEATTTSTVDRKNILNLTSGEIHSLRDINLYSGKDEIGNNSMFTFIGRAETYCGALVPFSTNPTLESTLEQNNEINVESGMNIISVRHSNLYADHGTENVKLLEARHSMYRDKTNKDVYVVSEKGLPSGVETYNNYVKVDGSITAGINNVVGITIGGTSMFIVKNDNDRDSIIAGGSDWKNHVYTFDEFLNLDSDVGLKIEADSSSGLTKDKFTLGFADYISNLGDRVEQLKKLVSDAEMSTDKTAYNAYKAELERVVNLKAKMENIQEGRQLYDAYIVIPDLVASGGNVNVDTGTLYGASTGKITAKGKPSITITNNTNLELRVNNIIVDEPGGLFNFNDKAISGTYDQIRAAVEEKNAVKGKGVGMEVEVPSAGTDNKITINGNWAGAEVSFNTSTDPDAEGKTYIDGSPANGAGTLYAVANIEINGNINSKQGDVTIYSASNDIIIEGKDAANSVNISGKEVRLNAPKGSITQGFTKGIVSIGGNVQTQFGTLYNNFINNNIGKGNSTSTYSYTDGGTISRDAGRISGGEIYINALDININGILQSGYERFFVTIDETAQAKINDLKNNNSNSDLSDLAVLGNPKYCVVEGKDVAHGNAGYFDRQIAVYYNPATNTLLTENVDASGGKIYLSGRISSTGSVLSGTGSGAIYCMDGAYNIDVTNKLPYDLKTNSLIVNDVSGLVQFTNLETGVKTQVTRGGIKYIGTKENESTGMMEEVTLNAADAGSQVFAQNGGYYFKPTENLRYTWTTGYSTTEYYEYEKEFMAKWWGLADAQKVDNDTMKNWSSGLTPIKHETGQSEGRPNGETIAVSSGSSQVSITHNKTGVEQSNRLIDTERWTTGYLGCHKRWKYTWRQTTGTVQSDVISVKADNNIGINFIGTSADNSVVKVQSTNSGNIILAGSTGNMLKYAVSGKEYIAEKGKVIVDAQKSSVLQNGGAIYGAAVELSAAKDINITSIVNGHDLTLSANVTQGGSVDITAKDRIGASVGDDISNIKIGKLGGTNVDTLNLRTEGNIVQQANAPAATADRINFTSTYGGVYGENNTYFRLQGGQQIVGGDSLSASVNVTADKDIRVQQTAGDLRIGKFHTDNGDVYISVPQGGVVDALPYAERTPMEETELLDLWKSLGMIEGGDSDLIAEKNKALANTTGTVYENYCEGVRTAFDRFTTIKDKSEAERSDLEKEELVIYQKQFRKPDSPEYFASAADFLAQDAQAAKLAEIGQTKQDTYKVWDKDLLLYQIDDAIVNPPSGVKTSEKAPNIFGKNINITVQNGVGLNSDKITEINMEHLDKNSVMFLSQVDPSTVTWKTNGSNESIAVITDRLAIGLQQSGEGSINITTTGNTKGNVFLENRIDGTLNLAPYTNLDIAKISAGAGNVTVTSLGSIYDVNTLTGINTNGYANVATISGNNVILMTGAVGTYDGTIGKADKYVRLDMSGNLTATATGNIYLEQAEVNGKAKDLNILTMAAGVAGQAYSTNSGNIYLKAAGNIYSVVQDSRVQGYFHSDSHGQIIFDAGGNIGYAEKADGSIDFTKTIRFKNSAVEAIAGDVHDTIKLYSATGSINVEGVSTADIDDDKTQAAGGYFNLVELDAAAENTIITVNGKFKLNGAVTVGKTFMLNINTDADVDNNITARDIFISATKNIRLADNVTLTAKTVTLTTGKAPELSYGTIAGYSGEGGTIRQGSLTNFDNVSGKMNFASGGNAANFFNSTSKIIANELKATASKGIYLVGGNDCNDVILHNSQENVVYHNVADVDPNKTGDLLTVGIGDYNESTKETTHILGTVWVYNEATDYTHDAKPMAVTSGVYAVNSIDLKSNGDLVNQYEIDSKQGSVYLEAGFNNGTYIKEGNLENYGSISTGSNVNDNSKVEIDATGNLHNHGEELNDLGVSIIGEDGVKISALKEVINEANLYALTGDVTIESQYAMKNTGNIYTVNSGNVTIKSSEEGLTSSGNVFAGNGSVTLNAKKTIRNTGDMFVYGAGSKVVMESLTGDVVNTDDLFFNDSLFMSLTGLSAPVAETTIYAYGGIELLAAQGNLYNSKELLSNGDIVLKAKGDIIIETDPWADESIYMDESSKMTRIKNIKTTGGSVTIEGKNVENNMQVEADKGIFVIAHADKDGSDNPIVNTGTIKVKSNNGHFITNSGNVELTADGYWEHSAYEGNQKFSISNGGVNDLITKCGDIILKGEYSVENVGDIIAKKGGDSTKGNAFLTSDSGYIYNYEYAGESYLEFTEMDATDGVTKKAVKDDWWASGIIRPRSIEVEGNITWKAIKVYNKAGQYAEGDLEIDVEKGGYNGGKIRAGGNVILKCNRENFTFTNSITAGENITLLNTSGSLKILDGASMKAGKDININAGDYVESGIRIEAGEGVNVYSENGHIKVENGITANNGMIRVYSQNDRAADGSSTANVLLGGTLYSANGSINISTNSGGIQANNVFAKDLAAVASWEGNVKITGNTKGQKVTFYTEDEAAELTFNKVEFGDEIIMAANGGEGGRAIDMSNVKALSDNYKMGLYGAGGTTGKGKYTLDYGNLDGQINIKNLKGDTINIVANEPVKIDNISVSKEANIYTMGIKTKIYGTVGPADAASNEIYYAPGGALSINLHEVFFDDVHPVPQNPAIRNKDKTAQVKKMMEDSSQFVTNHGGGKGMSLYIVDSSLQYGTGIVLMDTYGSNVMPNRYSVADTMIFLENIKAIVQHDNYFDTGLSFFDRYNIIDIPTVTVNSIGLSSRGQESDGIVVVQSKEDEYEF